MGVDAEPSSREFYVVHTFPLDPTKPVEDELKRCMALVYPPSPKGMLPKGSKGPSYGVFPGIPRAVEMIFAIDRELLQNRGLLEGPVGNDFYKKVVFDRQLKLETERGVPMPDRAEIMKARADRAARAAAAAGLVAPMDAQPSSSSAAAAAAAPTPKGKRSASAAEVDANSGNKKNGTDAAAQAAAAPLQDGEESGGEELGEEESASDEPVMV
jgi:hypothetical protein